MQVLPVTPLEMLSLAEIRRRDPELALRIAEQSAAQADQKRPLPEQAKEAALHLAVFVVAFPILFELAHWLRG